MSHLDDDEEELDGPEPPEGLDPQPPEGLDPEPPAGLYVPEKRHRRIDEPRPTGRRIDNHLTSHPGHLKVGEYRPGRLQPGEHRAGRRKAKKDWLLLRDLPFPKKQTTDETP